MPRAEANESSSSKTMIDGADCRALWKIWRRFSSLSPTHLLFNSGPDTTVTAAPISDAIALANSVLPVPGGPQKIMPLGISSSMPLDLLLAGRARPCGASTSRISLRSRSLTLA